MRALRGRLRATALALAVVGASFGAVDARAQEGAGGAPPPGASDPAAPPPPPPGALEPKALELLKATSDALAAAKTMAFTAVISYESPSRLGPPLVYTTESEVTMQRPDKLRIVTVGDGPPSEFYYDGKTMIALAPAENLVAVADAPPTIDAALEAAYHSADIYFPFTDVIAADPYRMIAEGLQQAFYMGQSRVVGGTTTDMVAYASDYAFVQIWIGTKDKLPRRLRAIFRDDPLRLRHDMMLSNWQIDRPVPSGAFASTKAKGARPIPFARPAPKPPTAGAPQEGAAPKNP